MRLAAVTAGAARADVEAARPASVLRRLPAGRARRSASTLVGRGGRHPTSTGSTPGRGASWPGSRRPGERPSPRPAHTRPRPEVQRRLTPATFTDGTHRSETPLAQGLEGSVDPRPPRMAACTSHAPARPRPISGRQPRRRLARVPRRPRKELAHRACARAALHTHLGVILDAVTLPGGRDVSDWGGGEERASRVPPGTRPRRAGARPGRGARGKARSRPSDRPESQEDAAPWAPPASAPRSGERGSGTRVCDKSPP